MLDSDRSCRDHRGGTRTRFKRTDGWTRGGIRNRRTQGYVAYVTVALRDGRAVNRCRRSMADVITTLDLSDRAGASMCNTSTRELNSPCKTASLLHRGALPTNERFPSAGGGRAGPTGPADGPTVGAEKREGGPSLPRARSSSRARRRKEAL